MTMREIADALDALVIELSNAHMPAADDPDRARKAYVLGIAAAAITQRASQLRAFSPVEDR